MLQVLTLMTNDRRDLGTYISQFMQQNIPVYILGKRIDHDFNMYFVQKSELEIKKIKKNHQKAAKGLYFVAAML